MGYGGVGARRRIEVPEKYVVGGENQKFARFSARWWYEAYAVMNRYSSGIVLMEDVHS